MKKIFILLTIISLMSSSATVIVTGGKNGNYFKLGKELNKKIFKNKAKVLNTQGSVENMIMVAEGKADIALVQADALNLLDVIYAKKNKRYFELVDIVGKVYSETLHILVNKQSKIKSFEELEDKTVSFGGLKSGSSVTASALEQKSEFNFKKVIDKPIAQSLVLLERGEIDAVFYVTKAPSSFLDKFRNIKMIPVKNDILSNKLLTYTSLKKNSYSFLNKRIKTYNVDTLLILKKGFKHKKKLLNSLNNSKKFSFKLQATNKIDTKKIKSRNILKLEQEILVKFADIYGYNAFTRYSYLVKKINNLKERKLVTQLKEVNKLINKLKSFNDLELCNIECRENKGYCDTKNIAIIKHLVLSKLGVNPSKLKIINIYKKNKIVLAYFHKKKNLPVILEYKKEIYKLEKGIDYKIINIKNTQLSKKAKKCILKATANSKEFSYKNIR